METDERLIPQIGGDFAHFLLPEAPEHSVSVQLQQKSDSGGRCAALHYAVQKLYFAETSIRRLPNLRGAEPKFSVGL